MNHWVLADEVVSEYERLYKHVPWVYRAPGRINLLGEHTDYNLGYVLPASIDKAAYLAIGASHDQLCHITSLDYHQTVSFSAEEVKRAEANHWVNYILGVVDQFYKDGLVVAPFRAVLKADVPIGGGLSSSAALESVVAFALNDMNQFRYARHELAKLAQKAENEFIGVRCGIMDMFTSLHGNPHAAIRLDCRDLSYRYVPLELGDYQLVLFDTGVKHALASSDFNKRRAECEEVVCLLQSDEKELHALRDVTIDQLEANRSILPETLFRRARYVIEENDRVEKACAYLENGDLAKFGQLMYICHQGLQNDYEVSCAELDYLVEAVMSFSYVLGARMMGGGFGGNTLNLIHHSAMDDVFQTIAPQYEGRFGQPLKMMVVKLAEGAGLIK